MNLREQEYILAIAHHGGIKGAAEALSLSAPTLSIFLTTLEKNTGVRLFDRIGKRFVPTDAGRLYLGAAQEMVQLKERFEAQLSDVRQGTAGTLRLGIHPRRTTYLIPMVLSEFSMQNPEIQVILHELSSPKMFEMLLAGNLDLIIDNRFHASPELEYHPFYDDRMVMAVSPAHPLADSGRWMQGERHPWIDLARFSGETFILQTPEQSSRVYTDQAIAFSHARPGKVQIIETLSTASQLAAEGFGIAFNFQSYARNFQYHKPLRYFLVGDPQTRIHYSLVRRKDRYLPTYLSEFMEVLRRYARQM